MTRTGTDTYLTVKGLDEQIAALKTFSDAAGFERALSVPMRYAMDKVAVPAIKAATPPTKVPNRPGGDYGYWGSAGKSGIQHGPTNVLRGGKGKRRGGIVKRGRRGPLAKTVTAKNARKSGFKTQGIAGREFAAINVGPRAWYRHFKIKGTRRGMVGVDYVGGVARSLDTDRIMEQMLAAPLSEYHRRLGKRITP